MTIPHAGELQAWLAPKAPCEPLLMWCHTTNLEALAKILSEGVMRPQLCAVFKKDLTYLFYGRPAYRFKNDKPLLDEYDWPVILVFKNKVEEFGEALYPFDSGAFMGKRYERWLNPAWPLGEFALDVGSHTHAKHVGAFYEKNDAYLLGRAKDIKTGSLGTDVKPAAISKMLREAHDAPADDRRIAIELIVNKEIPIDSDHVAAIVVPVDLIGPHSPTLMAAEAQGIVLYPYRLVTHQTGREHHRLLEEKVYELMEKNKCIK
jgi:hypothetical protein